MHYRFLTLDLLALLTFIFLFLKNGIYTLAKFKRPFLNEFEMKEMNSIHLKSLLSLDIFKHRQSKNIAPIFVMFKEPICLLAMCNFANGLNIALTDFDVLC